MRESSRIYAPINYVGGSSGVFRVENSEHSNQCPCSLAAEGAESPVQLKATAAGILGCRVQRLATRLVAQEFAEKFWPTRLEHIVG